MRKSDIMMKKNIKDMNITKALSKMKQTNRTNRERRLHRGLIACFLMLWALTGRVAAQGDEPYVIMTANGHYLAHVNNGGTWELQDATTFSPNCIWYSGNTVDNTGANHNYYFFDGTNYRFLSAPLEPSGALSLSASLPSISLLRNTDQIYYFYDWDWDNKPIDGAGVARGHQHTGLAQGECEDANHNYSWGAGQCWEVYWVGYYGGEWKLSDASSYNIITNAARFRKVTVNESSTPMEGGLTALNPSSHFDMVFEQSQNLTASITTPYRFKAYTQYTYYDKTNTTSYNYYYYSNAIHTTAPTGYTESASTISSYEWTISGEGANYLSFESGSDVNTSTSASPTLHYRVENTTGHKTATIKLKVTYEGGATQELTTTVTVKTPCQNPGQAATPAVNYENVIVSWVGTADKYKVELIKKSDVDANWTAATVFTDVTENTYTFTGLEYGIKYLYRVTAYCGTTYLPTAGTAYEFTTKATPGTLIYGSVYGGGRMADVEGKTEVIIINCDSIGAVYGGNDIAGAVKSTDGSTITIGVNSTDASTYGGSTNNPILIGSVYGGGNGFYAYNGTDFQAASSSYSSQSVAVGESVLSLISPSQVGAAVWTNTGSAADILNFPSIVITDITVNTDLVKIDSLFGGAKNAFVTHVIAVNGENNVYATNGSTITINGGTIFSVYGGNNYGGTQGYGKHKIEVTQTKTDLQTSITNTYSSGYGRDFGIRYLFGGGNKVEGSSTDILISSGQIDTLFGGGNAADVYIANVKVECPVSSGTGATFGSTYSDAISSYSGSTLSIKENYNWDGFSGIYNVRALFGGNNKASMSKVPNITLASGSVGTAYGGGNAGDMLAFNSTTISSVAVKYGTHIEMSSPTMLVDNLYGGCQRSNVDYSTWVEIKGGHVGNVYGGCNISGDVGSTRLNTTLTPIDEATATTAERRAYFLQYQQVQGATYVVATGGIIYKDLFAGSNGYYHCNDGINYVNGVDFDDPEHYYIGLPVPTHNETHVFVSKDETAGTAVEVKRNVYAGGNLACVGFTNNTVGTRPYPQFVGLSSVIMDGGTVNGDVYGGGNMASIYGSNEVKVSGGTIGGALYGGNDRTGTVAQMTSRVLPDEYDIASDTKTSLSDVNTYISLTGKPQVGTVYGGGNGDYKYGGVDGIKFCGTEPDYPIQSYTFVDIGIDGGANGGRIDTVYGGGNGVTVTGSTTVFLNVKNPNYDHDDVGVIFGGNNKGSLDILPDIILLNGQVNTVYGGCNKGGMTGSQTVTDADGDSYNNVGSLVHLRSEYTAGGSTVTPSAVVSGAVYGGCRMNSVTQNTLVLVEGGNHSTASLYGGSDISGEIGGLSQIMVKGGTVGNVYGGGNGNYYYNGNSVYETDQTTLISTELSTVTAPVCATTQVDIMGGAVGTSSSSANVFGGGYGHTTSVTGDVTVNIGDAAATALADCPTVWGDVYGGSALGNVNSSVSNTTAVNINNGAVKGNVYGGGLGYAELNANGYIVSGTTPIEALVNGNVQVNIGTATQSENFVVLGNGTDATGKVFGCNNLAGTPKGTVNVDVYKTAHDGNNTCPTTYPDDPSNIPAQTAYAINEVYGGGNLANYIPTTAAAPVVYIHNCDNTIEYVYGGGNAASVPATDVTIDGGRFLKIFGGGNGEGTGNPGADVTGPSTGDAIALTMKGGIADYLFGGSNTLGTITGTKNITISKDATTCNHAPVIANVFGGGNRAPGAGGTITITDCDFKVKNFYGGGNEAGIEGNLIVNIYGGTYENIFGGCNDAVVNGNVELNFYAGSTKNLFGGNNTDKQITGNIVVNVEQNTLYCPSFHVENVYGGGNLAPYGTSESNRGNYPQVNIKHTGTYDASNADDNCVKINVFGGGLGSTAQVWGNPQVTIGDGVDNHVVTVIGNVFGGGSQAQVNGNTKVVVKSTTTTVSGNVYGGGNQAAVTGNTDVQIGE